jgi:hypothetical protein
VLSLRDAYAMPSIFFMRRIFLEKFDTFKFEVINCAVRIIKFARQLLLWISIAIFSEIHETKRIVCRLFIDAVLTS